MTKNEIADAIRSYRKFVGKTQKDVSDALEMPQQTYSYYESGKGDVPGEMLISLAKYYGITVDRLITKSPSPPDNITA